MTQPTAAEHAWAIGRVLASAETPTPLRMGLFGASGAGRSYMLERLAEALAEMAPGLTVLHFDAWALGQGELWAALRGTLLAHLGDTRGAELVAKRVEVVRGELDLTEARSALAQWRSQRAPETCGRALPCGSAGAGAKALSSLMGVGAAAGIALSGAGALGLSVPIEPSFGPVAACAGLAAMGLVGWGAAVRRGRALEADVSAAEATLHGAREACAVLYAGAETVRAEATALSEALMKQAGRRVLLIDNLDRCATAQVAGLLDGLERLLAGGVELAVVIAADQHRMGQAFEQLHPQLVGGGVTAEDAIKQWTDVIYTLRPAERAGFGRVLFALEGREQDEPLPGPCPEADIGDADLKVLAAYAGLAQRHPRFAVRLLLRYRFAKQVALQDGTFDRRATACLLTLDGAHPRLAHKLISALSSGEKLPRPPATEAPLPSPEALRKALPSLVPYLQSV